MADADTTYVAGLTLLARRELSEAQVRLRLVRKGHAPEDVDAAIERLKRERAIDDGRVAEAIARTDASVHKRGRRQADQRIRSAGIAPDTAERAVERAYADVDTDALIEAVLSRRLRGHDRPLDERTRARLYRYLIGRGFESERVLSALRRIGAERDK